MKKCYLLIALSVLVGTGSFAQLTLDGEFRPRAEYSHGYGRLAEEEQDPSMFISQRTRLNLHYATENLRTGLSLQDVRTWGSQPQLVGNEDFALSVHEAWAEFRLGGAFFLKAGRMELVYDDHRILGSVNWAQQARSHDLALLKYERTTRFHLGMAFNQNTDRTNSFYGGPNAYKNMQFIWLNREFGGHKLSILLLNNGVHRTDRDSVGNITAEEVNYSQTLGLHDAFGSGDLTLTGSFYYQFGKDGSGNNLSAFQAHVVAAYAASSGTGISAGYEFLSGTAYDEAEANNSFTPFYGTNHKFNGFMDYFYVGNHANSVGLQDIYLKVSHKRNRLSLTGFAHIFLAAAAPGPDLENYLGTEVDLVAAYSLSPMVSVNLGYSQMFAGETMEALKGGNRNEIQNWAWLMIVVKPTFLQTGGE